MSEGMLIIQIYSYIYILCISFFFSFLTYIFIADNISILMCIMRVILSLFSALSYRVGALQIFIIIIIIICTY